MTSQAEYSHEAGVLIKRRQKKTRCKKTKTKKKEKKRKESNKERKKTVDLLHMNLTMKLVFFISLSAAVLVVFVLASLFFAGILTSPFGSPGLNPCLQYFSGSTDTAKDMTGLSTCHQVDSFHGVNTSDRDFIVGGETVRYFAILVDGQCCFKAKTRPDVVWRQYYG